METRETILLEMILDELKEANRQNQTCKEELIHIKYIVDGWNNHGVPAK